MTTYTVKTITSTRYLVEAVDPQEAIWSFGENDPFLLEEEIVVFDEDGNQVLSESYIKQ